MGINGDIFRTSSRTEEEPAWSPAVDVSTPARIWWSTAGELLKSMPQAFRSKRCFQRLLKTGVLIRYQVPGVRGPVYDLRECHRRLDDYVKKFKIGR